MEVLETCEVSSTFLCFLVSFIETSYLCYRKIAALIGSGNSSNFTKYRDKLRFSMAGHALRGNL